MSGEELSRDGRGLKTMTRVLVDAVGGPGVAKEVLGHRSPSTVSQYQSVSFPDRFLPIDDLLALEIVAGRPIVSSWMMQRQAEEQPLQRRTLSLADVARLAKEGGEAKMAIVDALADGKIDALDRQTVARELRQARDLYDELLAAVEDGA